MVRQRTFRESLEIARAHKEAHRKQKHYLTSVGILFVCLLLAIFLRLIVKGSLIQTFILLTAFWFYRRVYISVLIPKLESDADVYAARVFGAPKTYRETLRKQKSFQDAISWRYKNCLRVHIQERCTFLKQAFKAKDGSGKLRASIRKLTMFIWSANIVLLCVILTMESDYVKSIGASRCDKLSVKYYRGKNFDQAIKYARKAVEKDPDNFGYLYNLAIAYVQKGKLDRAMTLLEKVVEINPAYPEGHYNLGIIYGQKGWVDKEIEEFKNVVSIDENLPDAHYSLGLAYQKKGLSDKAILSLKKAIPLYPPEDPWRQRAIEIVKELEKEQL